MLKKLKKTKNIIRRYVYWRHGWKMTAAVLVIVFTLGIASYSMLHVSADTAILVPDGDVTGAWGSPGTGGTNDGSCSGGTRCNFVDEGVTDKTTDYITTAGKTTGGEIEEYTLSTVAGISSASQVAVRIYTQVASVGGSQTDTLTVNLRVNGTLQTAGTCTPTTSWSACTVTFNGSWTQANVDSMQVYIQRNVFGNGPAASRADTINLANVYATLTYVPSLTQTQSGYRWFDNQDVTSQTTFVKAWGGTGSDTGNSLVQTTDGGYAVAGTTASYGAGGNDAFLAKYDSSGNLSWSRTWGGAGADEGNSLVQTTDGGYAMTGYTGNYGAGGGRDMFLAKFDSSGTLGWSRTWGGSGWDEGHFLVQTTDGGYAVTGYTDSYGAGGGGDAFLAKYDASGTLSWSRTWGGTGYDEGNALVQTGDSGYAVTGYTASYGAGGDMFLAKFDGSGTLAWSRTWGGTGSDTGNSLVQTTDGGYAVTGQTSSYGTAGDMFIAKYDSAGTLAWSRTWGGSGADEGNAIAQTSDGGYAVTGFAASYGTAGDMFLAKYDANGNLSWSKTWGGTGQDYGSAIIQASDGGYAVAGTTASYGTAGDMFLAKFDLSGSITGCASPMCQSPTAGTTSPTAITSSPTPSTSGPTATVSSPTAGTSSPTATSTVVVATSAPTMPTGAARAATNTLMTAPDEGTIFRLRLTIHMAGSTVNANTASFQLQYAAKGPAASCSVVPTEKFINVTDITPISYADNPLATNGIVPATSANDPQHGTDTNIPQAYYEKGTTTFTNPNGIASGQDGLWDFALRTNQTLQNTNYCLRVVKAGGSLLDSYTAYPELMTPSARFTQATYRWYNNEPAGGSSTFIKTYGNTGNDRGNDLVQTTDGGYAITGVYTDGGSGEDAYTAKYDASGNLSWSRVWGDMYDDQGNSIVQTSDGGYAITGSTYSYSSGNVDVLILKYDASGNLSWSKALPIGVDDYGQSIVQTSDGGYAITGYFSNFSLGIDMFLAKLDSSGNLSWTRTWGGSGNDYGYSLIQTTDGGYAVTGTAASYGAGGADVLLVKLDSSGNLSWTRTWGDVLNDYGYSLVQTTDGGYAVTGSYFTYSQVFLIKYDSFGNLEWAKTWGDVRNDTGNSLVQTTDGGYAITGTYQTYNSFNGSTSTFMLLTKIDASGNLSWTRTWGGTGFDRGNAIVQTTDGGYAVTGYTDSYGAGGYDMFLAKYDASGNISGCPSSMCNVRNTPTGSPAAPTSSPTISIFSIPTNSTDVYSYLGNPTITTTVLVGSSVTIGNPLAALNRPLDLATLTPLSLRIAVRVDGSGINTGAQSFKLQYAMPTGETSCAAVAGGAFADVTAATPIAYYDDSRYSNGQALSNDANDPSDGSRTMKLQSYHESNNFTNTASPINAGEGGIWQFSLNINNTTLKGRSFCMRIATSDGTLLATTGTVPDVAYAPQMQQLMGGGEWFARGTGKRQWKNL